MSMTTFNGKKMNECLDDFDFIYYDIPPRLSKLPTPVLAVFDLPVA